LAKITVTTNAGGKSVLTGHIIVKVSNQGSSQERIQEGAKATHQLVLELPWGQLRRAHRGALESREELR
jgi:alkylhydroperoxidase/carboxymuconolactone decarboxylase family protein YurZ